MAWLLFGIEGLDGEPDQAMMILDIYRRLPPDYQKILDGVALSMLHIKYRQ